MSYEDAIRRMREVPEGERLRLRWEAIPQQVADSMAFEGEPVDLEWLKNLHSMAEPPAGLKPA